MTVIEVIQEPAAIIEVITDGNYEMVVEVPPPVEFEVQGLFASTFISQDVDGGTIF
jgi:hypothetical protein